MYVCIYRQLLKKEREEREDIDRQRRELEGRLQQYETDFSKARVGMKAFFSVLVIYLYFWRYSTKKNFLYF